MVTCFGALATIIRPILQILGYEMCSDRYENIIDLIRLAYVHSKISFLSNSEYF